MARSLGQLLGRVANLYREGRGDAARRLVEDATADGAQMSDAYVALQAPQVPLTWEAFGTIESDQAESPILPIRFPKPVQLIGIRPTIRPLSFLPLPPLVAPSLDDVLLSISIDREKQLTAQQQPGTTSAAGSSFVSAGALSLGLPRLLAQEITSPTPQLDFQFRWRQGTGVFVACSVSVAVYARYL
jgi:hypothetical protein